MYVPFTMTFYKVVVYLNSMFFPPYIYITVRHYIRRLTIKGYFFALTNDKNVSIILNEIPNYLRHISREIV